MVKIELNLFNLFALRTKKDKLEYEGNNVGDIIKQFINDFKETLGEGVLTKNKKKLNPQMLVLLNGRNITYLNNYKTKLKEGDKLYLSFPISGG
jgi:molybdopterin converting factor small subunit